MGNKTDQHMFGFIPEEHSKIDFNITNKPTTKNILFVHHLSVHSRIFAQFARIDQGKNKSRPIVNMLCRVGLIS